MVRYNRLVGDSTRIDLQVSNLHAPCGPTLNRICDRTGAMQLIRRCANAERSALLRFGHSDRAQLVRPERRPKTMFDGRTEGPHNGGRNLTTGL